MPEKKIKQEPILPIQPAGEDISKDFQKGISQDELQDLRSDFFPIGMLLQSKNGKPNPNEVRDWTIAGYESRDNSGDKTLDLYIMVNGQWWSLNDYRETATGASGCINQLNSGAQYGIASSSTIYEMNSTLETTGADKWVNVELNNMLYSDGVFTIKRSGKFAIDWSAGIYSTGANQEYSIGILKNGVQTYGWNHRYVGSINQEGALSAGTILDLRKGDKISLGYQNITSSTNLFVEHAHLKLNRIRQGE